MKCPHNDEPRWFETLIGLEDTRGRLCVLAERARNKSKVRLGFLDLATMDIKMVPLHKVVVKQDARNTALLANALRYLVGSKGVTFDRGAAAPQIKHGSGIFNDAPEVRSVLWLYEAGYRETLWPRYYWVLPYSMDLVNGLLWAMCAEVQTPDIVGQYDVRKPVSLTPPVRTPEKV